ncbi:outer membrane protein TolC [Hoeflea halophila]|uniref:Outer membrane protein TolC n=1 Tax=Hoeflea halophila TaxID=714899 RepID=A0A286IHB7_9HYPH|nr:TolC family protein [Hoeflea halophila]SOE19046.1 outer membrane protein TolC [Hoeflea halophila]
MGRKETLFRMPLAITLACSVSACSIHPAPFTESHFTLRAKNNIQRMAAYQEPISGAISLGEAMARALKYNLELRIKQEEASLAKAKLDLQHYSLLPKAVLNSGYTSRNNLQASTSLNLITNRADNSPSTSQDRQQISTDISLGWDILDFGLSYIKAQQSSDEVLISRENWRGTLHKLMEDVRTQYWRASTYERLIGRLKKLQSRTDAALANSAKRSRGYETNRLVALNSERELVKVKQAINDLEQDLINAKIELARLMNLRPGTEFSLDISRRPHNHLRINMPLDDIFLLAVSKRPELRQNEYEQRINIKESQANILNMVPSLRAYATGNQNSNSFLLNSNWVSVGAAMSWSLLNVFQYPAKRHVTRSKQQLLDMKARSLTMTVMTQVYLGLIRYDYFIDKLAMAEQLLSVQKRLTRQMRLEAKASRVSEQELILEEMNELIAEARCDIAYADLQRAYGGLLASIGIEFSPTAESDVPLDVLAKALEAGWDAALEHIHDADLIVNETRPVQG